MTTCPSIRLNMWSITISCPVTVGKSFIGIQNVTTCPGLSYNVIFIWVSVRSVRLYISAVKWGGLWRCVCEDSWPLGGVCITAVCLLRCCIVGFGVYGELSLQICRKSPACRHQARLFSVFITVFSKNFNHNFPSSNQSSINNFLY